MRHIPVLLIMYFKPLLESIRYLEASLFLVEIRYSDYHRIDLTLRLKDLGKCFQRMLISRVTVWSRMRTGHLKLLGHQSTIRLNLPLYAYTHFTVPIDWCPPSCSLPYITVCHHLFSKPSIRKRTPPVTCNYRQAFGLIIDSRSTTLLLALMLWPICGLRVDDLVYSISLCPV